METEYFNAYKVPRGEKNRGRLKHNLTGKGIRYERGMGRAGRRNNMNTPTRPFS